MWHGMYFKSAKNWRMNTYFAVNAIKFPSPPLARNRVVFNKTMDGNTISNLHNHITSSHPNVHSSLLEEGGK